MVSDPNPFVRTREDHESEIAEDYVELIFRLGETEGLNPVRTIDLVNRLGVAQPTVTKALERLQRDGLVSVKPRKSVELTKEGYALAKSSLERHEVIVEFLKAIGVDDHQAELDTEGMEHHVSETTLEAMRRFLQRS